MKAAHYISAIESELRNELPGREIQYEMAPKDRPHSNNEKTNPLLPEKAAVLVLLYPQNGSISTVFIQRTDHPGAHRGQISFPGGRYEVSDGDLANTALRETGEELGISTKNIKIIGKLTPLYISVSNFEVFPYVGIMPVATEFVVEKEEVLFAITEILPSLQDPSIIEELEIKTETRSILAPCYNVQGFKIWGATAMMLREFLEVVKKAGINSAQ